MLFLQVMRALKSRQPVKDTGFDWLKKCKDYLHLVDLATQIA